MSRLPTATAQTRPMSPADYSRTWHAIRRTHVRAMASTPCFSRAVPERSDWFVTGLERRHPVGEWRAACIRAHPCQPNLAVRSRTESSIVTQPRSSLGAPGVGSEQDFRKRRGTAASITSPHRTRRNFPSRSAKEWNYEPDVHWRTGCTADHAQGRGAGLRLSTRRESSRLCAIAGRPPARTGKAQPAEIPGSDCR